MSSDVERCLCGRDGDGAVGKMDWKWFSHYKWGWEGVTYCQPDQRLRLDAGTCLHYRMCGGRRTQMKHTRLPWKD